MSGFGKIFPSWGKAPTEAPKLPEPKPEQEPWWYIKALAEMGQKEIPGHDDNKRIVYYHSFTTLKATDDETPWCSSFMCYLFNGGTRSAAAKSYAKFGKGIESFKKYCIVVFKRPGGHHVALGVEDRGKKILCLGGNQSNKVCLSEYDKANVIAYRWPE